MAENKDFILKGKIKVESEEAVKNSNEVTEAVKKTGKALKDNVDIAKRYSLSIENITNRMRTFATYRIAAGVINSVSNAIKEGVRSAVDLQTEFANIQAITGSTDATMGKLRDTILRVGQASKYSAEEIASSTVMLGQAGLSAEEINNVLETTTQLAAATGSELSNTVDLMTSSLAVWGLNSEEATHLSDVMVTGMNRTKATLETFRMAVQYAGATAASLNVNFEELAAVSSAAANAGLRASVVGTGLRAVMAELISPTKKMVEGLRSMGLTTEDVDIASRGLIPVLKSLKSAGLDASNAYDMFGRRAATFVLAAQGQLDVIDELQLAFAEQGATLKAYNTQMDTVSAQTTALGNTIKAICNDILESISGMIVGFLKGVNKALQAVRRFFGDENKINFEEGKSQLEGDLKSTSAFGKYLDNIKEGLEEDVDSADKLNKTVDAINKQFGTTVDYVGPTEKIADAWERISSAIQSVDEDKLSELNFLKQQTVNSVLDKELGSLKNKIKFNEFDRDVIRSKTGEYLESLRSGGNVEEIERNISSLEKMERITSEKALEIAKKAYDLVGSYSTSTNLIPDLTEGLSQSDPLSVALSGKGNLPTPKKSDSGEGKNIKSKTTSLGSSSIEDPKTFAQGFSDAIFEMENTYRNANLGKMIAEDLGDGMGDALYSITSGAKSMKDAFRDLALSVVEEIQKMITKMIALKAIESGMSIFTGGITESGGVSASGSITSKGANGGLAARLRAASGSLVRGGIQGRDSVPAVLMPGEYVLKKSAVDALGTNFLNNLNNNAAQTLTNTAANMVSENPWESDDSEPAVVNVWVVSKEEEAKIGPNDIIATIGKDIMTGGQTRRLIQSVVAGRK